LKKIIIANLFLFVFLLPSFGNAQQDTIQRFVINSDTVYSNINYMIYTYDKENYICKIFAANKNTVLIFVKDHLETIETNNILKIVNLKDVDLDLVGMQKVVNYPPRFSFGLGWAFPDNTLNYTSRGKFTQGINVFAGTFFQFNNYLGFRTDFDFSSFRKNDYHESYYEYYNNATYYHSEYGGSVNNYSVRCNLSTGYLKPKEKFNLCINFCAGFGYYHVSEKKSISYHSGSVSNYYEYITPAQTLFFFTGGIGIEFSYKINEKLRIKIEPQYNLLSNDPPNHSTLRIGIIL
jgi:hypothetical protein